MPSSGAAGLLIGWVGVPLKRRTAPLQEISKGTAYFNDSPAPSDYNPCLSVPGDFCRCFVAMPAAPPPVESLSYEAAIEELQSLVDRMDGEGLTLDASLAAYQRGVALVKHCQAKLAATEQQVKVLEADLLKTFEAKGSVDGAGT
jgi:exodeoxyribonuclease VII small subunit